MESVDIPLPSPLSAEDEAREVVQVEEELKRPSSPSADDAALGKGSSPNAMAVEEESTLYGRMDAVDQAVPSPTSLADVVAVISVASTDVEASLNRGLKLLGARVCTCTT